MRRGAPISFAQIHDHGRFYMFTTAITPASAAGALAAIETVMRDDTLVRRLSENTARLRAGLKALGLRILGHDHPITPILVGDEEKAREFSRELLQEGVYIGAICFPIVPRGEARLRAQPSAAHSAADIDEAIAAIGKAARRIGLIGGSGHGVNGPDQWAFADPDRSRLAGSQPGSASDKN